MRNRTLIVLLASLAAVVSSCLADSVQRVPMPDQAVSLEYASGSRLYCLRDSGIYGKRMRVRVYEGDTEIGAIRQGDFLCWERDPGRALVRAVLEYKEAKSAAELVARESFLDVRCEPGQVYFCVVELDSHDAQPKLRLASAQEGRELLERSQPAPAD
jgi:hypothetical protein